jgi:hypothetical protein
MHKPIYWGLVAATLTLCFTISPAAQESSVSSHALLNLHSRIDTPWREALHQAIDPDDYECDGNTDFRLWISDQIFNDIGLPTFFALLDFGALDWPTYYSLFIDNDARDDYIGVDGEHTQELVKRHKDNQRFWDVYTDDVLLQGMHGAVIADDAKMLPTVKLYYLFERGEVKTDAEAQAIIDGAQALIEGTIGYNHPFLTLNAFAFSAEGIDYLGTGEIVPDKIVMGEGIIQALDDIGLVDNAPDYVHAHEFAHHVQYELGVLADYGTGPVDDIPAETRRIELMADAFAAYYCAHARGATFQAKRIVDAYAAAYGVGDCFFDNPGHHGTPNQREAATMWGADLAASAKKQGHINSAELMLEMFDAVLPDLIAPDAD